MKSLFDLCCIIFSKLDRKQINRAKNTTVNSPVVLDKIAESLELPSVNCYHCYSVSTRPGKLLYSVWRLSRISRDEMFKLSVLNGDIETVRRLNIKIDRGRRGQSLLTQASIRDHVNVVRHYLKDILYLIKEFRYSRNNFGNRLPIAILKYDAVNVFKLLYRTIDWNPEDFAKYNAVRCMTAVNVNNISLVDYCLTKNYRNIYQLIEQELEG